MNVRGRRSYVVKAGIGFGVLFAVMVSAARPSSAADPDPKKLIYEMVDAAKEIKDFTATFTKVERLKGKLRPRERMLMKFRAHPFSVYFKWIERNEGREVIYQEGRYDNMIQGHQPVGPLNFKASADPNSAMAREHSKRPITEAGFENAAKLIVEVCDIAKARNELNLAYLGTETCDGRPVHVIARTLPEKKKGYPLYLLLLYIDKEYKIPVKIVGYNWEYQLEGMYVYSDIKLNVGLTDKDFDMANPDYDFPGILPFGKLKWPFGK